MLGSSYGGGTGAELGRLVVYLAPWMVASVAVTVAYPLLFVRGRARWLPLLAVRRARACTCSSSGRGRAAFGLAGVAAGLGGDDGRSSSPSILACARRARADAARGSLLAAARLRRGRRGRVRRCPRLVVGPLAAAVVGLVVYVARARRLAAAPGCAQAWAYVRALQ